MRRKCYHIMLIIITHILGIKDKPKKRCFTAVYNSHNDNLLTTEDESHKMQSEPLDLSCEQNHSIARGLNVTSTEVSNHECQDINLETMKFLDSIFSFMDANKIAEAYNLHAITNELPSENQRTEIFERIQKRYKTSVEKKEDNIEPGLRKDGMESEENDVERLSNNSVQNIVSSNKKSRMEAEFSPITYLHTFDINEGIMKAIVEHFGKQNQINASAYAINYEKSIFENDQGLVYFDFQAFFNVHNEITDLSVIQGGSKPVSKRIKVDLNNADIKKRIDILIACLQAASYSKNETLIENYIDGLKCSKCVKFIRNSAMDSNTPFSPGKLNDNHHLKDVSDSFYKYLVNVYDEFKRYACFEFHGIDLQTSYINCITNMLFYTKDERKIYILKPDIWELQLFMPEFYLYIIWKLKQVNQIKTVNLEHNLYLICEINLIFRLCILFREFCVLRASNSIYIDCFDLAVASFRSFILQYLKKFHSNTPSFVLYTYGSEEYNQKSGSEGKETVSMILNLLAFTGMSQYILEYKSLNEANFQMTIPEKMTRSIFIQSILMNVTCLKKETLAILQSMEIFFSLLKNMQNEIDHNKPTIIAFKMRSLLILENTYDQKIYILSLMNNETFQYYSEIIYAALSQSINQ